MTELERERARRGLPPYAEKVAWWMHGRRGEGQSGHLSVLETGRLRTMIARMIADDPATSDIRIAERFAAETGKAITQCTVSAHRRRMGIPRWRERVGRAA